MFSLMLYLSCIAFFLKNSNDFIRELSLNSIIVATQPNSAYRGAFKLFTLTILPVGFLSFFPIEYVRTHSSIFFWLTLLGTSAFLGVACWLFKKGLARYESGNLFAYRN
jgi:ABC-2 type transport system permease protein